MEANFLNIFNTQPLKQKLVYIIYNVDKSILFENTVEALLGEFDLSVIILHNTKTVLESFLAKRGVPYLFVYYTKKKDVFSAIGKIYSFLKKVKPEIVHTHFLDANITGLVAARLAGVKQVIYTRHHSTEHHIYSPKGVYFDRISNKLSNKIVAISEGVKTVLISEGVPENKISVIHHGYNLQSFDNVSPDRVRHIKDKYGLTENAPVVGVISRYVHWKGIQFIIPAFKKILEEFPDAILILANSSGDFKLEIQKLLKEIPSKNFREILFEQDMYALFKTFSVFVHTPINNLAEAFGLIYIEALASCIPSVFTLSGVANEFIQHGENALVADFSNSEDIYQHVSSILKHRGRYNQMVLNGKKDVNNLFNLELYVKRLKKLYRE